MPNRYIRDTVLLAKIETVYGTDPVPTGAANAILISNVRITPLDAQFVSRDVLRNFFGASEELISTFNKAVSFEVEAVGGGAAGTAPAWGPLVRACGWAETLVAAERVTYKPITNGQEGVTIYIYDSGILHKMTGCKGMLGVSMTLGAIPKMKFSFIGIDSGDSAATPVGTSFTGFQVPEVVTDQFSGDLTLGGTLAPTPGAVSITAGTTYPSRGLELDMGIKADYIPLLGQQSVEITDRRPKADIQVDATVVQEIAFYTAIKATTLQSIGLLHGTVVGRRFGVFAPSAQLITPSKEEISGKRLIGIKANLLPTAAGNDEVNLVVF